MLLLIAAHLLGTFNFPMFTDFYRFYRTFLGDFTPDRLDSRSLQTLWERFSSNCLSIAFLMVLGRRSTETSSPVEDLKISKSNITNFLFFVLFVLHLLNSKVSKKEVHAKMNSKNVSPNGSRTRNRTRNKLPKSRGTTKRTN